MTISDSHQPWLSHMSIKRQIKSAKRKLKAQFQSQPALWRTYRGFKMQTQRLLMLRYYAYDIVNTYHTMFWRPGSTDKRTLSASLLFQYHKLEKGLAMPGPHRLFGVEPAGAVMDHLNRWVTAGFDRSERIYLGALETLDAYYRRIVDANLDPHGKITPRLENFLARHDAREPLLTTPQALPPLIPGAYEAFRALAHRRRSVRNFRTDPVPPGILADAVALAQLSPSVCNRQSCKVYAVTEPGLKSALLEQQNGNRGFGHLAPQLLVITSDQRDFFDATERNQPYVDGGLFCMSLTLALAAQGVASCCLNWCVPPENDRAVHRLLCLPVSDRVIMMMVIGYAIDGCEVPRSPRRALESVLSVRDH